jgi:quinol monooxygenase YgiN
MPVVLVATFDPKPDHVDALVDALAGVLPGVHAESGCEKYALHRGRDRVVLIEKWSDRDALAAHGSGEAIAAVGKAIDGLVAGPPDVIRLDPVPVGGAAGAI